MDSENVYWIWLSIAMMWDRVLYRLSNITDWDLVLDWLMFENRVSEEDVNCTFTIVMNELSQVNDLFDGLSWILINAS